MTESFPEFPGDAPAAPEAPADARPPRKKNIGYL